MTAPLFSPNVNYRIRKNGAGVHTRYDIDTIPKSSMSQKENIVEKLIEKRIVNNSIMEPEV